MRFIAVRDFRTKSSEIWRKLSEEKEMVITSNGRPIAIISSISENDMEESLSAFRRARAISAVEKIQERSVSLGTDKITLDEIEKEITTVRTARRG